MVLNQHNKSSSLAKREAVQGILCILPGIIGLLVFMIAPIMVAFFLSFTEWPILESPRWIGIANYVELLRDSLFWTSLKVTLLYTLGALPLGIVVSITLAILLNRSLRGITFFRVLYYLPVIMSGVAVSVLWRWIFNPDAGLMNQILGYFHIEGPLWIFSEKWVLPSFILMSVWAMGGMMLIYLAALQGIPQQLYEAAEIDGANIWQKFWRITLPMLTPTIFFNLVMGLIASFQIFTPAWIMTQGGPGTASLFYVLYLYQQAFISLRMGYASSLSWILFLLVVSAALLIFKTRARWVYYEVERSK